MEIKMPLRIIALFLGVCLLYFVFLKRGYQVAFMLAVLPVLLFIGGYFLHSSFKLFYLFFVFNYIVMGLNRYFEFKAGLLMLFFSLLILVLQTFHSAWLPDRIEYKNARNPMLFIWLIWLAFCCLQLFRTDTIFEAWSIDIGAYAYYAIFTFLIISIYLKRCKDLKFILFLWSVLTLLAAAKGYYQKNHGFDSAELRWLWIGGGARTHIITSGIRYFSFFTDASNFGSSMAMSMIVFAIISFYTKNKFLRIYFVAVSLVAGYGMLISGTRSAMMVPFAGVCAFVIFSGKKNATISALIVLVGMFFFFKFTTIGNSSALIRRMRTAFDFNQDASFQVRMHNQNELQTYMSDRWFGVGMGMSAGRASRWIAHSKIPTNANDSWLVMVWTETGVVGLTLYISLMGILFMWGSYIILFKIKNKQLQGILAGMFAGAIGLFASSYGNEVMGFPNGVLVWTCESFVFIGPYLDKEMEKWDQGKALL